jgi:hypothetical protein
MRKVNEVSWSAVQQATEYEDRVKVLEELIEEERSAHEASLKKHELLAKDAVEQADTLRRESEERFRQLVSAADAKAKDADERAEMVRRRAEEDVAAAQREAEVRVQEIRRWAEARMRECEDQKTFEVQQMHEKTVQRQRQMEETLYLNGRQKSEALTEAKRHSGKMEQEFREAKAIQEIDIARKEARLEEWTLKQRQQNLSLENQHKGLLELEKGLHARTMERTMQRTLRHLEYGDGPTGGKDTPTRHMLRDLTSSSANSNGPLALTAGSPLARAGGTLTSNGTKDV